ncbi:MAG: hypothetical protein ABIB55_01640 [Candidatus Nealsonbacteria bacterium]
MSWKRILKILVLIFLIVATTIINPISVLTLSLSRMGFDFPKVFWCILAWTSFTLTLTYYGTNLITNLPPVKLVLNKLKYWYSRNNAVKENVRQQKWLQNRLIQLRNWAVVLLGLIPVSYLPTALIITTRLLDIRGGIFFLLLTNSVRLWFYVYGVQRLSQWLFSW